VTNYRGPELRARMPRLAVSIARRARGTSELLLQAALKLEGGAMWSATAREIMSACHAVEIGAYTYGACFVPGAFPPGTQIGRYVSIADDVRALGRNHPLDRVSMHPFFFNKACGFVREDAEPFGGLDIGHDAWLGLRAILAPGCRRVGLGAVVAAGAVVTHDVPDFAVVAGVPARVVRHRFPQAVQDAVRASRWWEQSVDECVARLDEMTRSLASPIAGHPLLAGPREVASPCS
jgi:virginiamycin A acetyltransferase